MNFMSELNVVSMFSMVTALINPQIKNIMLKFWGSEVNEFDEIVMPYNKSAEIIKKIDEFEQENGTSLAA